MAKNPKGFALVCSQAETEQLLRSRKFFNNFSAVARLIAGFGDSYSFKPGTDLAFRGEIGHNSTPPATATRLLVEGVKVVTN